MQVEEYLKVYQPIIYQTFLNEMNNDRLSHAYLIEGKSGTPLFEVAYCLGKTLVCDDPSPFACNSCITCLRVDDGNYPNFVIIKAENGTIKKGQVQALESAFDKEGFEAKGIRCYIIDLVENMNEEAVNSLLKFLEEPHPNIYAFLTTNNIGVLLPTVVSRCQTFHLKTLNRNKVINDAIKLGVDKEDAEFLSYFYNEPNLLLEVTQDDDLFSAYQKAKKSLKELFTAIKNDPKEAIFLAQSKISSVLRGKDTIGFFIDMITEVLEDLVALHNGDNIYLESNRDLLEGALDRIKSPSEALIETLKAKGKLHLNINSSLLLDNLIFTLLGE